jgi:hypothetical protein
MEQEMATGLSVVSGNTLSRQKRRRVGRPTLKRNRVLTNGEKCKRYRTKVKRLKKLNGQEWYLPKNIVAVCRKALGGRIDTDPASCEIANKVVRAETFYSKETDGLRQEWQGTVLLNPPYKARDIAAFTTKLLDELAKGNVTEAILVCQPKTDAKWFTNAARQSSIICFTRRIDFWNPNRPMPTGTFKSTGTVTRPTNGQAIFYFGKHPKRFQAAFKQYDRFYRLVG